MIFQLGFLFLLLPILQSFIITPRNINNKRIMMSGNTDSVPQSQSMRASSTIKQVLQPTAAAAAMLAVLTGANAVFADDATPAPEVAKVELGPVPTNFGISQKDYFADAQQVVDHMRYACQMEKGNPSIVQVASAVKDEMIDFVSFYRKFKTVAGKQSFSLLYTSINVLAGHYTSYGTKIPVPEKRRKRLLQELNDIEKNIRKKR